MSATTELPVPTTFIIKVAGACNLDCTYCYVYNKGDTTFRTRPALMSLATARLALERIFSFARARSLPFVAIVIHGGEPLLVGRRWLSAFLRSVVDASAGIDVEVGLQTNGTLLDEEWLDVLAAARVHLGISLDGAPFVHDAARIDHHGRGTYHRVRAAIELLRRREETAPKWGVLAVANPARSGVEAYEHFRGMGIDWMDFLWPDYHHDSPPPWPAGTMARYYIDLFDRWYGEGNPNIRIRWFHSLLRLILQGRSDLDALGPHPLTELVIESDGSIEPLDVLRTCGHGFANLGLNVARDEIGSVYETALYSECIHNQELLAETCRRCEVLPFCGAGYLPHRWGAGHRFGNPSVYCEDLYRIIMHIAGRVRSELAAVSSAARSAPARISASVSSSAARADGESAAIPAR